MELNRRAFLQQAGLTLATFGVSQASLFAWASRYQNALAEPTHRKLALLVGINQYPEAAYKSPLGQGGPLTGCVTDVELQRELLMSRFGFQASDILTLTDKQATRQAIQTAFLEHLSNQARPGDVVVFHFSGYGSQVKLSDSLGSLHHSLVPVDALIPTQEHPTINDFWEETLWLLLRSLKTQKIATILDASYVDSFASIQGSLHVRSRSVTPVGQISPEEQALQEQLLTQLKLSREQLRAQQQAGQVPGIWLAAARDQDVAVEGQWAGWSAGLFTYALTQQLWWATPATTLHMVLSQATSRIEQRIGHEQRPKLMGQKNQGSGSPYYLSPQPGLGADGVITAVKEGGKTVDLWLGGLPAAVLEQYRPNALLEVVPEAIATPFPAGESSRGSGVAGDRRAKLMLQLRSRDGLMAEARLWSPELSGDAALHSGQLVWETLRLLPRDVGLTVALAPTLERIERVDATSAFASIPTVSSVVTSDQPADCVFGKAQGIVQVASAVVIPPAGAGPEAATEPLAPTPGTVPLIPKGGYGLFGLGRAAIPNTLADSEEAVKTAINRLIPQLKTLLATKLLRLTANEGTSRLAVRAVLERVAPQERLVMQQQTSRVTNAPPDSRVAPLLTAAGEIAAIPVNSRIQYRLYNDSDRPLYFMLLGFDSSGSAIALYPTMPASEDGSAQPPSEGGLIQANEMLVVPQLSASSEWTIHGPKGFSENYVIFSATPFRHTLDVLSGAMQSMSNARRVALLSRPLDVAQALLADLHQASLDHMKDQNMEIPADTYGLHADVWATLSFVYQIV